MIKKSLAAILVGALTLTTLAGCGSASSNESGKKLVISTWGLSEDLLNENVFKPFEEKYGVDVVLEIGNNSERLTKLQNNPNSNVDLIYLAESFAEQGIEAGLFEEIDYSKIPNAELLNEKAQTTVERGFGPAYTLNSIGIVVDPSAGVEINSFEDLWKPELAGKIAIPDITTTNGPAIVAMASEKAGVNLESDNGAAAFKELEALKPNVVKTYSKSSDLANMFSSGEIVAAVSANFAYETIAKAKPEVKYVVPESGTYLNFNTININKNSKNKDLAYEFINYALSEEVQARAAKALSESPVNTKVELTDAEAKNLTHGSVVDNAKVLNFEYINSQMSTWLDTWNRIMN